MQHAISESCYKGMILQRNHRKMVIFMVKNGEPRYDSLISKSVLLPGVFKRSALYVDLSSNESISKCFIVNKSVILLNLHQYKIHKIKIH